MIDKQIIASRTKIKQVSSLSKSVEKKIKKENKRSSVLEYIKKEWYTMFNQKLDEVLATVFYNLVKNGKIKQIISNAKDVEKSMRKRSRKSSKRSTKSKRKKTQRKKRVSQSGGGFIGDVLDTLAGAKQVPVSTLGSTKSFISGESNTLGPIISPSSAVETNTNLHAPVKQVDTHLPVFEPKASTTEGLFSQVDMTSSVTE